MLPISTDISNKNDLLNFYKNSSDLFYIDDYNCNNQRFSSKDNRHKPWGGRHVLLFDDPAQLPPVSNTDVQH